MCCLQVGFDNDGKFLAIVATAYGDCGAVFTGLDTDEHTYRHVDSGENCSFGNERI